VLDVAHLLDLGRAVVDPVFVGAPVQVGEALRAAEGTAGVLLGGLDRGVAVLDGLEEFLGAVVAVDAPEAVEVGLLALQGALGVQPVVLGEVAEGLVVGRQGRGKEEKAARARVRWIMSGLLVASAMSWERSSRWVISRWYDSTVWVALPLVS
jgi:hypothetical protein